ncbi:hypothetical protein BGZ76_010068 [Entomortierella beljakovae]|nr:hypothetical protein BGZ76_010068 [Entomortierella beljakovae]
MPASLSNQCQLQQLQKKQQHNELQPFQTSIFKLLPSELILDIFSRIDIVSIFRFLDTCRYHRHLLLGMPGIWRTVRFIPISEYANMSSSSSSSTLLSIAATAGTVASTSNPGELNNGPQFTKPYHKRPLRNIRKDSSSESSESDKDESTEAGLKDQGSSDSKLKHSENDRDKDRGGSQSLISEIYAVLRRFRKENRLVDYVREINMDSTDSPQFPSPLVMLIKFPHLEVLSSRYRRKQTSLNTDAYTLRDMLKNGDIVPHSLKLKRWDLFHPYMIKEDYTEFKKILDAISIVGENKEQDQKSDDSHPSSESLDTIGVVLDIHLCQGQIPGLSNTAAANAVAGPQTTSQPTVGLHWATSSSTNTPPTNQLSEIQESFVTCGNIVWALEKCLGCGSPQEECWKCMSKCSVCDSPRSPPYINHMKTTKQYIKQVSDGVTTTTNNIPTSQHNGRPTTPPGSISLSEMRNPSQHIRTAYILNGSLATSSSILPISQPIPLIVNQLPEFSLFD